MILYLLYLLHFHLPSSFRVDILVCLFFVSLISSPASCTIPFFLCEVPTLMIDSDCPSILKSNMQARMQVLFLCVCAIPFLSFASSQFAYWLKELLEVQISLCTAHLWIFFYRFSHPLLKVINSSGDKLNFPWYNLLCYPSELSTIFMYQQCLGCFYL